MGWTAGGLRYGPHGSPYEMMTDDGQNRARGGACAGGCQTRVTAAVLGHTFLLSSQILDQKSPGSSPGGAFEGPCRLGGGRALVVSAAVGCRIGRAGTTLP